MPGLVGKIYIARPNSAQGYIREEVMTFYVGGPLLGLPGNHYFQNNRGPIRRASVGQRQYNRKSLGAVISVFSINSPSINHAYQCLGSSALIGIARWTACFA